jgi:hypothetical protein
MAFPTVADADTKNGTVTSNSTTWVMTYPTNIAADDLLVCFVAIDGGSATLTFPAGWLVKVGVATSANQGYLVLKIATGAETGTFNVTTPSEQGAWRIFRIPAASWFGGSLGTFNTDDGDGIGRTTTTGASANPDPPSHTAAWGVADTLWFTWLSVDTSRTVSDFPDQFLSTFSDVSGGAGGATLAGGRWENGLSATVNPNTFTISSSDDWVAGTFAVRPAAAVATDPVNRHMSPLMAGVPNF